jgi:YVTN family beta-propeller protein
MKVKYGFLGILIITLILTSTHPGVFVGLEWVWASNVISTVDVGDGPSALAFNPTNNNIYVTNPVSDDVSVIQTNSSKPIVDATSDQSISISNLV